MHIFKLNKNQLEQLNETSFQTELEIQKITESNLDEIFNLEYVKSQLPINNFRIDTLAFDNESKSFCIIEYKKDLNFSVIDQGYAYLSTLLNNKAEFVLEYNESKDISLKKSELDWSQSKVIFVSPKFSKYQKQAINFKDLPIELWEVSKFDDNLILYNQIKAPEISESITEIAKGSEVINTVSREIKVYTEEYHLNQVPDEIKEFYEKVKDRILSLGENIEIVPRKYYIAFKANTNFVDIQLQQSQMKLTINLIEGELYVFHCRFLQSRRVTVNLPGSTWILISSPILKPASCSQRPRRRMKGARVR